MRQLIKSKLTHKIRMPELPEVERVSRIFRDHGLNQRITSVSANEDNIIFCDSPGSHERFIQCLNGSKISEVGRKGNYFYIRVESGSEPTKQHYWIVMHLGMTGDVKIRGGVWHSYASHKEYAVKRSKGVEAEEININEPSTIWPPRFHKFLVVFENGVELAFTDPRRLGRIRILEGVETPLDHHPLNALGFDPILNMPSLGDFTKMVQTRKNCAIKALLLDQSFSAGIGNWIADEVLYQARIHPLERCGAVNDAQLMALHEAIERVCCTAVKHNADSRLFPEWWLFHFRWTHKKKGRDFEGREIVVVTAGGRTSAVVPALQKLNKVGVKKEKEVVVKKEEVKVELKEELKEKEKRGGKRKVEVKNEEEASTLSGRMTRSKSRKLS